MILPKQQNRPCPSKKLNSCVSVGRGGKKLLFYFPLSHLIFFLGKKTKYLPSEMLPTMIYKSLGLGLPISSLGETPSGVVSPGAGKKAFKIILFLFLGLALCGMPPWPLLRGRVLWSPPCSGAPRFALGLCLCSTTCAWAPRSLFLAFLQGCFYFWSLRT